MQFGCCGPVEQAAAIEKAGYDFYEPTVTGTLLPEAPQADFDRLRAQADALRIRPQAFNVFLPRDLPIVGPVVDGARIARYVETATKRARLLGGEVIVFGSGGARTVPEGFSRQEATEQIKTFLRVTGEAAALAGVRIAIEPLNARESNILNSVPEATEMAQEVDHRAIGVLADLYHIEMDGQPYEDVEAARGRLWHVHVADSERLHPGSGSYDYPRFFRLLHALGYEARVSVECRFTDFASQGPAAVAFLRQRWQEVLG